MDDERRKAIKHLRHLRIPMVIMDAPYRLIPVLEDVEATLGSGATVTLALDLTLPGEAILRGPVGEVRKSLSQRKGEFVLIVH